MNKDKVQELQELLYISFEGYDIVDDKDEKLSMKHITVEKCLLVSSNGNWNANSRLTDIQFQSLVQPKLDWTKVKTIYRYPHLDLSRDKLSILKDKYGTKVVRDPNKADVRIISKKGIDKLTTSYYRCSLSSLGFIVDIYKKNTQVLSLKLQHKLNHLVEKFGRDHKVILEGGYNRYYGGSKVANQPVFDILEDLEKIEGSGYTTVIKGDNIDQYKCHMDPNIVFVEDVYVNHVTSEDSIAIDDTNFEQINNMLKSPSDREVGMTMMANCNIAKSITWVGLLFYHNWENMKGTKTWTQVAFKTLKKQFEKYNFSYHSSDISTYSSLIKLLIDDNALTIEAVNHIQKLVFDEVICRDDGFNKKDQVFELNINSIKLTDDAKSHIKQGKSLSDVVIEAKSNRYEKEYDLPF
jgi:hypothetical protein